NTARVWIRVAFEGEDKGRVFGRGGRNIQAIRTVVAAAATAAGHSAYLDIYGSQASTNLAADFEAGQIEPTQSRERRGTNPKPVVKPRSSSSLE
ncbi:MAG: KH domain-containing protein, partial [Chroococcidiopsidaceae cyanobacterium CP_BM_RX_35]|nr:KH domain-containing protein [Chroococcidiopsidaceae cyanobacterium CP_BM_RX_35]